MVEAPYSVSSLAGTIVPIAGMGISLGILAHTARNITRMSDDMYGRPRKRKRKNARRRPSYGYGRPNNYRQNRIRTIPLRPVYNWKM